jgi:hypothetical protein
MSSFYLSDSASFIVYPFFRRFFSGLIALVLMSQIVTSSLQPSCSKQKRPSVGTVSKIALMPLSPDPAHPHGTG